MRIAYVCTDPGIEIFGTKGAAIHVRAVITELLRQGHEVQLITPRPGDRPTLPVPIHQLPAVSGNAAAERERSAQASDAAVAAALDAVAPDLVYERYALWGRTGTAWAAAHGVPSLLEVNAPLTIEQATFRSLVDQGGAERVAEDALSTASAVVCVSAGVADWARVVSRRSDRIAVIGNGVDPARISPARRPVAAAEATDFTVGFIGSLKAWHGVDTLIRALARLRGDRHPWRGLIVGDGPMRQDLARLADDLGVAEAIEFTGAVTGDRVAGQLRRFDIACAPYPALGRFYFSPLKVYEYLAAGLPVIGSAIGEIPDVLDHGRLGRLAPPGDPAALADELVLLRRDHDERRRLRARTREAALTRHSWAGVVNRSLALLDLAAVA
ncbi:glycosyltransferase family 4 protein [Microlunatus speluncae]|uniref:glycosyltransferase family 4 protein n=1 Tax=Microlunatus speluncae TaxID=2594267 RepID=UPI0012666EF0|nr:glycosyltransferase family 4 protein [Microlunatus speluncae]